MLYFVHYGIWKCSQHDISILWLKSCWPLISDKPWQRGPVKNKFFTTKEMLSISSLCSFGLYVAIFQQCLHMEYISLSYGRHHHLVNRYRISVSQITTGVSHSRRNQFQVLSPFITYHRVWNSSNPTGANSVAGTADSSGAHEFTPGF